MMTEYTFLKPWLTALVLPPGSPLLLILLGYLMAVRSTRVLWMALGKLLFVTAFVALYLFCCQGVAETTRAGAAGVSAMGGRMSVKVVPRPTALSTRSAPS